MMTEQSTEKMMMFKQSNLVASNLVASNLAASNLAASGVLAVALALAAGCNKQAEPTPQLVSPAKSTVAADKPNATDFEHSSMADSEVPFVLELVTPKAIPAKGETFEVTAVIQANKGWSTPTKIAISLPKGAKLVAGDVRETLADLPAGETKRVFRIKLDERLTDADPVAVKVDMRDAQGRFGASAKRAFPERKVVTPTSNVPKPPMGRPGKGIDAHQFDPSKRTAPGTRRSAP